MQHERDIKIIRRDMLFHSIDVYETRRLFSFFSYQRTRRIYETQREEKPQKHRAQTNMNRQNDKPAKWLFLEQP
jgi:hypothetical protein